MRTRKRPDLIETFLRTHKSPFNRACHAAAAGLFLAALPLLLTRRRRGALWLGLAGASLLGLGHLAEGELPAVLQTRRRVSRKH